MVKHHVGTVCGVYGFSFKLSISRLMGVAELLQKVLVYAAAMVRKHDETYNQE